MTAMLRGQAHFAPAAYLCNGIDRGVGFWANRAEDVMEREALDRWQFGRCGLVHGLVLLRHVWLGWRAVEDEMQEFVPCEYLLSIAVAR